MAGRKTTSEQLAAVLLKQEKLKEKEKELRKKKNAENRKNKDKRLIKIGATVENIYGKTIEENQIPKLEKFLLEQEKRGMFFSKALEKNEEDGK